MITEFTPFQSLFGGALIGLSAGLFMLLNGRIAGIAGILGRLVPMTSTDDRAGSVAFVGGLLAASVLWLILQGNWPQQTVSDSPIRMAIAGLLVGFGTILGSGCTSGHGVCGLSRLSVRSLVAVMIFMIVAALVVYFDRHVVGF